MEQLEHLMMIDMDGNCKIDQDHLVIRTSHEEYSAANQTVNLVPGFYILQSGPQKTQKYSDLVGKRYAPKKSTLQSPLFDRPLAEKMSEEKRRTAQEQSGHMANIGIETQMINDHR